MNTRRTLRMKVRRAHEEALRHGKILRVESLHSINHWMQRGSQLYHEHPIASVSASSAAGALIGAGFGKRTFELLRESICNRMESAMRSGAKVVGDAVTILIQKALLSGEHEHRASTMAASTEHETRHTGS